MGVVYNDCFGLYSIFTSTPTPIPSTNSPGVKFEYFGKKNDCLLYDISIMDIDPPLYDLTKGLQQFQNYQSKSGCKTISIVDC